MLSIDVMKQACMTIIATLMLASPVMASGESNALGIKAFRSGDYAKAEQLYKQALNEETSKTALASVYRNLAVLYQAQNRDGAEFTSKSDELDPPPKPPEAKSADEKTASPKRTDTQMMQEYKGPYLQQCTQKADAEFAAYLKKEGWFVYGGVKEGVFYNGSKGIQVNKLMKLHPNDGGSHEKTMQITYPFLVTSAGVTMLAPIYAIWFQH